MKKTGIVFMLILASIAYGGQCCVTQSKENCSIVPQPRECQSVDLPDVVIDESTTVFYNSQCPVENYAAGHLKDSLKKHYNVDIQLNGDTEKAGQSKNTVEIVLGVTEKDSFIQQFCKKNNIDINTKLPGYDGFIIKTAAVKSSKVIIIAGANLRGVTYGTSVLFDMLNLGDGKLTCPAVYIRDWATIEWRGRPTEYLSLQTPESLDTCVHSRINFIDVRDTNVPGGHALFGFPPGVPIDTAKVKKVIDDAHERGIFVFGTVSCGVPPEKFDAAIETFKELIALNVDGLWISYDDPGPGKDAPLLTSRVIELAKQHNITPDKVAITPPSGSYQEIDTVWNKQVVAAPDADKMRWFFTRIPNDFDDKLMKKLGFSSELCWWHNWPRPKGGLLNDFGGGRPLYNSKWAYYELLPLSAGWNNPTTDELKVAGNYSDMVMLWQTRPADYDCHILGLWAWNPETHDFNAVSETAYSYVFGNAQAPAARLFDRKLAKLKPYFTTPLYKNANPNIWPPRLLDVNDRPAVIELLNDMELLMQTIEKGSPSQTMLSGENLKIDYLQPMRDIVTYGKKMVNLDYPEYTLKDFPNKMLDLASKQDTKAIDVETGKIRADVEKKCEIISSELAGLKYIDAYVKQWEDYIKGSDFWIEEYKKVQAQKAEAEQKRQEAKQRFEELVKGDYSKLFADQGKPAKGKVLLEISSDAIQHGRYHARGAWAVGMYDNKAVAIGSSSQWSYKDTDMAMLSTEVTIPNFTKRLYLEVYIAHVMKDTQTPARADVRLSALRVDGKTIWNQDLTVPLKGWQVNDITDVAKSGEKVNIRFNVSNRIQSDGYESIVFFGPARLVER
ncbi:MAG: glycoside hydrolase family 20 zincin-like fold domain-containing protein [Phycisphaerae bacterium]